MSYFFDIFSNIYFLAGLSIVFAFLAAIRIFPVIIHTVRAKNIMDEPGGRKMHSTKIPTLGGIGLFASFSLTLILFGIYFELDRPDLIKLLSIIGSTIILLFLGIKDDLIAIPPKKKLVFQLIATGVVVFMADVRIMNFDGLLGIWELPYFASVIFTFFVFILVINAFNLIDGIDGLAGSIAVLGCCTFGIFFFQNGQNLMFLVSFTLIGATLGFLSFNLSKKASKKLFMGDSGSMFIGFLLAFQGIIFLTTGSANNTLQTTSNAAIILLAILSYPLLDTMRVFSIRAKQKRSPFSPDHNHIHHRLLSLGLSHRQSTLYIITFNWILIGVAFMCKNLNINLQLLICVVIGSLFYLLPFSAIFNKLIGKFTIKEFGLPQIEKKTFSLNTKVNEPSANIPNEGNDVEEGVVEVLNGTDGSGENKDLEIQRLMEKRKSVFQKGILK